MEASLPYRLKSPGSLFWIARIVVFILVILHSAQAIVGLPVKYQNLANLEPNNGLSGWTQAEMHAALQSLGISPQLFAIVLFSASLVSLLSFWTVAWLLFLKKGDSIVGLLSFFVLTGVGVGFSFLIPDSSNLTGIVIAFYNAYALLIWIMFFLLLYLFPDGRFVPPWTRFLAPLPFIIFLLSIGYGDNEPGWLGGIAIAYLIGGGISQVYRYLRVSNREQRQQTKWIVLVIAIFTAIMLTDPISQLLFPSLNAKTPSLFLFDVFANYILSVLVTALLPVSIAFSILRYRLWDIDVIIRKTLIYTVVTGLLALVYFGGVFLAQNLFSGSALQKSPLTIVLSTLAIVVLFNPIRKRVQAGVDQRFFRRKYDAQKALESFATQARDEVELEQLSTHLLRVVNETMQPERASLWIRK